MTPIPYGIDANSDYYVQSLPLVNAVEVSRDEYPKLFQDNVKGLSVYRSSDKENLIRKVYDEKTN